MTTNKNNSKFRLGGLYSTPGALRALADAGQTALPFIARHSSGDWGDVCATDKKLNDQALVNGDRLVSAYKLTTDVKIWVITECDRSVTTVLLPEEY